MTLYICTDQRGIAQAKSICNGSSDNDWLLLVHDAVADTSTSGPHVVRAFDDMEMRGLVATTDAVDAGNIVKLIASHQRVIVL